MSVVAWAFIGVLGVLDRLIRTFFIRGAHIQSASATGLEGLPWAFASLLLVMIVGMATIRFFVRRQLPMLGAGLLIIVGGINNIVDIFFYNGVIDYLQIQSLWGVFWFNISDLMILCSVIYWFIDLLLNWQNNKPVKQ